jgi:hypothetical protein
MEIQVASNRWRPPVSVPPVGCLQSQGWEAVKRQLAGRQGGTWANGSARVAIIGSRGLGVVGREAEPESSVKVGEVGRRAGGGAQGGRSDWVRGFPIGPRPYGRREERERVSAVDEVGWTTCSTPGHQCYFSHPETRLHLNQCYHSKLEHCSMSNHLICHL